MTKADRNKVTPPPTEPIEGPPPKWHELPKGIDWVLSVVEPIIVFLIIFVVCRSTFWLLWGQEKDVHRILVADTMKLVSDHWQASSILVFVLFYRTVRIFLEEVQEGPFSLKRKKNLQEDDAKKAKNPHVKS